MIAKLVILFSVLTTLTFADEINAPVAQKIPTKLKKHGDTRTDNYFWMRNKKDPKVLAHLNAENKYRESVLADTRELQEKLYQEMRARIKEEDQSAPFKMRDYLYYNKTLKNQEYPIFCRKKIVENGKEEIIINVNELAHGLDSIKIGSPAIHFEQNLLAYGVDTKGDRVFTIYFKDLSTGKLLEQKIENVTENYIWAESGKNLYYAKHDPTTLRSNKIFKYDLDKKNSKLVYEEKDEKFEAMVYKTQARQFIFIMSNSTLSSEVRFASARDLDAKFKVIAPREKNIEYNVFDGVDRFYIRTNWNARNFKVMEVRLGDTRKQKWKDVISERPDVFIDGLEVFKDYLIMSERSKGLTQINVFGIKDKTNSYINFPDAAYTVMVAENLDYEAKSVRYNFESMNRPESVFDYDIESKKSSLLKEKEVPGYDSSQYVSERVFATSSDGKQIPISLVYKKGLKKDSSAPLFVYGYGSYGISSDPYFSSIRVSLLDRGFIFAIIHVRGGSEMGRAWYEDGKFLKKKNTFNDFIIGTEFLLKEKYGSPKKVYANGGSAGGLLMGAIMNMRPDLYHGIVADVPFVDVVTTMLDTSIPLTTGEYEEWGNPNDKKYYEYMLSYSPYDNVVAQNYPHLLVTTGLNDSQVPYWEPAKWVSKIRELRLDKSKLLIMKIEMDVGHGGKSGRFEYIRNEALMYSFILKLLEKNEV
jgi:oligopeptidase B